MENKATFLIVLLFVLTFLALGLEMNQLVAVESYLNVMLGA